MSSFFIQCVPNGVVARFGESVSRSEPLRSGEKCTYSHRFFAVGFGWVFLGRREPNQAESDAAGTKEPVYLNWGGMGNSPQRDVTDSSKW